MNLLYTTKFRTRHFAFRLDFDTLKAPALSNGIFVTKRPQKYTINHYVGKVRVLSA